jgi:hypothetical protein
MADEYGWINISDANTYMATRLGASKYWTDTAEKAAALQTAYNQLVGCGLFSFPSTAAQVMKDAQCEMALFLLAHQEDMDVRLGLQAQGVSAAGIVNETYKPEEIDGIPIPPIVRKLLEAYETASPISIATLERDEEEDLN